MKIPDTDFANFASLNPLTQRTELVLFNTFHPSLNYYPFRKIAETVLNISSFEKFTSRPDFGYLVEQIIKYSNRKDSEKYGQLIKLNLKALRAFYDFSVDHDVHGVRENFGTFLYTQEGGIKPFSESVIFIDNVPYITFFDMRAKNHLTPMGQKFVFSVMHHHIRMRYPDLMDIELAILHLKNPTKKIRQVQLIASEQMTLFTLQELEQMVVNLFKEIRFVAAA